MNKTTTANIGGVVYNLEVDAYDKLKKYLDAIANHYDDSEGRNEIMADIESRIAELLNDRLTGENQVVTMEDVQHVISVMGEPDDFADPDFDEEFKSENKRRAKSKMFRDPDNKMIGGVCSGLGYYFNIDPVWLRLLFIIILFGGGSGLLIYIVLWAIIPEANTTAEKLQMKGQPINIDNIGKSIDQEFQKMKDNIDSFTERTSKIDTSGTLDKITAALSKMIQFIVNIVTNILSAVVKVLLAIVSFLGKTIGLFFILFGVVLLVFLASALLNSSSVLSITSEGFHYYSLHQFFGYISDISAHWIMFLLILILFIGIPLIGLVYGGYRLLMPNRASFANKSVGLSLFVLWIIGVILAVVLSFQIGMEFKNEAKVEEQSDPFTLPYKAIQIKVNDSMFNDVLDESFDHKFVFKYNGKNGETEMFRLGKLLFPGDEKSEFIGIPRLNIQRSNGNFFKVKIRKYADGLTPRIAERRARTITYNYSIQDSSIVFDPAFMMDNEEILFRDQSVKVDLFIPENTIIVLSASSERLVYNLSNISNDWLNRKARGWNWEMGGYSWRMTHEGLACLTCEDRQGNVLDTIEIQAIQPTDSIP